MESKQREFINTKTFAAHFFTYLSEHSLKSGPETQNPGTRDPGLKTRDPGTRDSGILDPGTWDPDTRDPGNGTLRI